jgi:hypothetical protein
MEILREFWGLVAALIGVIVWLVRLEAGMKTNRENIERLGRERLADMLRADKQRDVMDRNITDIRTDIKQILLLLNSKVDR